MRQTQDVWLDEQIESEPDNDMRNFMRSRRAEAAQKMERVVRTFYATGPAN